MWFTDQIAAGELLVEYHKYHSNFEQSVSTSSKRYFLGFQDYGGEGVDVSYADKYLSFRLCYSLHSSFAEIVDVLKTLKPKRVTPIAAPFTSQLTPKRLFQIVDHYIRDVQDPSKLSHTSQLNEKIQRKPVNPKLQIKRRYESIEQRRRRHRRKEKPKEPDDELDLDLDNPAEKELLQRVHSLQDIQRKKVQQIDAKPLLIKCKTCPFRTDIDVLVDRLAISLDVSTAKDEKPSLSPINHSDLPLHSSITSDNLPLVDRQRTLSDASSATVDYDFDSETCTALSNAEF